MRNVRFVSNRGVPMGSKLIDVQSGLELRGFRRIVATVEVDNVNILEAEFVGAELDVEGVLRTHFIDPETGEMRHVAKIIWANGEEWIA
jgi:hypothetical protein